MAPAWHAALAGKFIFEELTRIPVEVDYGSEYRYRNPVVEPGTLAIAITQSGETVDTLEAMAEAQRQGARIASIVNVVGSQADRVSEAKISRAGWAGDSGCKHQGLHGHDS